MIPDQLRIQPGQEALTPEQEAEVKRFAEARIEAQLSTESVDESEAEQLLRQAYAVASLPLPTHIHWLDGPLQAVAALAPPSLEASTRTIVEASLGGSFGTSIQTSLWANLKASLWASIEADLGYSINHRVWNRIAARVWFAIGDLVKDSLWESVDTEKDFLWPSLHIRGPDLWESVGVSLEESIQASVKAYEDAATLANYRFLDAYLAPNGLHALAHFNEQVSGYWLGNETALLVRRPRVLVCDQQGRLHSETGKCVEFRDGWGFYAWHGVRVPERVILAPEQLTREDFLSEENVEVRRVIQERMGARFVTELGGQVIDTSPRGTLYEVELPADDPERVARYVQVQDASTERQYFLRVPPDRKSTRLNSSHIPLS